MCNVDYIVVGCGLAGIAFCEQLKAHNKTFVVFDNNSQTSSIAAAGLYNPVILKRFSEVWKAKEQLEIALPLYTKLQEDLETTLDYKLKILKRFSSIEEQNMWFNATDKIALAPYLSTQLIKNNNPNIKAPYHFGEVLHAGRIDTKQLITKYKQFLKLQGILKLHTFNYKALKISEDIIQYKNYNAKHIVFAEGFGVKKNPFFKALPLNGTKGEVLIIKAPNLNIDFVLKFSVFIIPIGNDLYIVGSTYNWNDKSNTPTKEGKTELISKLKTVISCNFEVINHAAGIRPTVKDRRPLVGCHAQYKNAHILNGLGTRGVMIAPYIANALFQYIEKGKKLDKTIDVNRFY